MWIWLEPIDKFFSLFLAECLPFKLHSKITQNPRKMVNIDLMYLLEFFSNVILFCIAIQLEQVSREIISANHQSLLGMYTV